MDLNNPQVVEKLTRILEKESINPHFDEWKWKDEYHNIVELAMTTTKGKTPEAAKLINIAKGLFVRFVGNSVNSLGGGEFLKKDIKEYEQLTRDLERDASHRP